MSDAPDMQVHESLALLNRLNLIEWLSSDVEYSTRLVINAAFHDLLDTEDPEDFFPSSWSDAIKEALTNWHPPEDLFDLASGHYVDGIELNAQSIGFSISDHDSMLTDEEAEKAAIGFAKEWASNVRLALRKAIDKTAGR